MKKLAVLAAFVIAPAVQAENLPQRKPGLWEMQVSNAAQPGKTPLIKQCIDAASDAELQRRSLQPMGGKVECSKQALKQTSTGWVSDSVCKLPQTTATTHAEMTGDLNSAYTVESKTSFDPPLNGMKQSEHKVAVRWIGPCPADMKPGDMLVNGRTINMLEMQKAGAGGGKMTPEQMKQLMEKMKQREGGAGQ
ncbi:DUF3617 family protein [Niveibacterium sp. SC-1]|uniref:DUF3617 domain-containing protein n=1 Tax=Niveibacterium sp. SC-1 TaxID=3135646 RepID=UPI00311FA0D0